jgi:hypothetical protein
MSNGPGVPTQPPPESPPPDGGDGGGGGGGVGEIPPPVIDVPPPVVGIPPPEPGGQQLSAITIYAGPAVIVVVDSYDDVVVVPETTGIVEVNTLSRGVSQV